MVKFHKKSNFTSFKHLFILMIIIFCSLLFIKSDVNVKFLTTAVQIDSIVKFEWEEANQSDVDAKIVFYKTNTYPSHEQHFVENSFAYLNPQSQIKKSNPEKNGVVEIKAPSVEGLYKIYYCAENFDGFFCTVGKPIAVISCKNKSNNIKTSSKIEHVIVILSENHSFDSIYGKYCKAEEYSKPNCNYGPNCCEKIPEKINGLSPVILTDVQNSRFDPCHASYCEISEINGGKMDKYVIGGTGSHPNNFAAAEDDLFSGKFYFEWARNFAIADNFFQSSAGASCQNDMYFATAKFIFRDNEVRPQSRNLNGSKCYQEGFLSYYEPTVADLLNACGVSWTFFAEGFNENPNSEQCYPRFYDASDNPFTYFPSLTESENSKHSFRDYKNIIEDIEKGTLPAVNYIKFLGIHSEHPGYDGSFLTGQMLSNTVINKVLQSEFYKNNTLVILVPDESGGFYDHVTSSETSTIDGTKYGPRTQFVLAGNMVKKNYISHVKMEPSSIIQFIEWNFIGDVGQLDARDKIVNNIGDMINQELGGFIPSLIENYSMSEENKRFSGSETERFNILKFLN